MNKARRKLSVAEAVGAAGVLFELNTDEHGVLALAEKAGISCSGARRGMFLEEWRAFVHAAVLYALMVHAPNIVVVEYLRTTQDMLAKLGYAAGDAGKFVDGPFKAYSDLMVGNDIVKCPETFFRRLEGKGIAEVPGHSAAVVSGTMAMVVSAVLDKLEQYDYGTD